MAGIIIQICDPTAFSLEEAVQRARSCAVSTPTFELHLVQYLHAQCLTARVPLPVIFRGLDVLGGLLSGSAADQSRVITLLRPFLKSSDPQIASKAVLVLGRQSQSISWLRTVINETDQRVRANMVESLWMRTEPDLEAVFESALKDSHPRVVANAIYGLILRKSPIAQAALNRMIADGNPAFRRSAVWVLKKAGLPDASSKLQALIHDSEPAVRTAAFDALKHLGNKKAREVRAA